MYREGIVVGEGEDSSIEALEERIRKDLLEIEKSGSGEILGKVPVIAMDLRRYSRRDHTPGEPPTRQPLYVIETRLHGGQGKEFAYSGLEILQRFAADVENQHENRILLLSNSNRKIPTPMWYTARSIVNHHNVFMDRIYPFQNPNPNPFLEKTGSDSLIELADALEMFVLERAGD